MLQFEASLVTLISSLPQASRTIQLTLLDCMLLPTTVSVYL